MQHQATQNYETGRIAVDPVIFTIRDQKLMVYLNPREKEPFEGLLELPGGLLLPDETAEETLLRKLRTVIGINQVFFEQFYTFTEPDRDPRVRTVSIAFMALVGQEKVLNQTHFYELTKLPHLAFDHRQVIDKAFHFLQHNLGHEVVKQFLPEYFPLNDLQAIYEVITREKLDNRNFRKKMLDSGLIKKVEKLQENVSHRPASLYRFV